VRLLIDTNVVIPLEPTRADEVHVNTQAAAELVRIAIQYGHTICLHPAIGEDIARDADEQRRRMLRALLPKYPLVPHPPSSAEVESTLGTPPHGSNDWVDQQLLAALHANAVDFLVTEDMGIMRGARRLGLDGRVFTIAAAAAHLSSLLDVTPPPPPRVVDTYAHALKGSDPIFDSFRDDYGPEFDSWLRKCQTQQRRTWRVDVGNTIAAFVIVNEETNPAEQHGGKTLKICSFKVGSEFRGFRFGELLLKAVFGFAEVNRYAAAFVTVLPKHEELVALFEGFGFSTTGDRTSLGELILVKQFAVAFSADAALSPLDFHVRYGPRALRSPDDPAFLIPIQPRYSDVLFPENAVYHSLFPGHFPFGNGLRKAYLSHSGIRALPVGATLYFYRSQMDRGLIAVGVLERIIVSECPEMIAREVARRTVYTLREIEALCSQGPVLALLFRQSRVLVPYVRVRDLTGAGVFRYPPQSIQRVGEEGGRWLFQRTAA
jgi:ribosomal protein S18 acetylase RimI-like enzyme